MCFQIGNKTDTQEPFSLATKDIVNGRTYIASITRYGKSWTCRKIVEEVFGHCGIIIVDPEGEYSSLREKYPFLIIGVDVPIQIETAAFLAEQVLNNELSVIIDTSKERNDKEYVRRFLEQFFYLETTARKPYLLIVEESEDYAPEKGAPGTQECLPVLIAYAKKGGKRGIGCIFVGHRPAWISKGILSQCSNKALGKIESTDFKALEEYARVPKLTVESLPNLKPGEFCFTGDWVSAGVAFIKVGGVKTTHLGMTPEIIPPSPKALENVIEKLQKSLSKAIEIMKPKTESISETEARLRKKFEDETIAIKKTADEKAERKYHAEIEQLRKQLGDTSRALSLQPQAPITNVLEHPIVKARMVQMDQRSRDLLTKIEQEPGLTREKLAAFLSTSTNTVSNVVEQINRSVFKAQAIIDDGGRPIKYCSMLKRLFLTDVGRREIDELNRLQEGLKGKDQAIVQLKDKLQLQLAEDNVLRTTMQQQKEALESMSKDLQKDKEVMKETNTKLELISQAKDKLTEEVARLRKLSRIGEVIEEVIRETAKGTPLPQSVEPADLSLIKKSIEELRTQFNERVSTSSSASEESVGVKTVKTIVLVADEERIIPVEGTDTLRGKLLKMALDGFFGGWKNATVTYNFLVENAMLPEKANGSEEVGQALSQLAKEGILGMKHTDRNWYKIAPNMIVKLVASEAREKGLLKEA